MVLLMLCRKVALTFLQLELQLALVSPFWLLESAMHLGKLFHILDSCTYVRIHIFLLLKIMYECYIHTSIRTCNSCILPWCATAAIKC